ncbi:hypothetical protein R3P38DRAFT_2730993, partial [Favolaschia claudopus]
MESLFADRIGTNYVPSDSEIEQIQVDLASHAEELALIDARIRELSEQRDKLQTYIHAHKALISPTRRLPRDILEEIFLKCIPSGRCAVISVKEAPFLLCGVCSAWRTIAMSTPKLWASLHIPLGFILAEGLRPSVVFEWLNRAAACLLSLSIIDSYGWGDIPAGVDHDIQEFVQSLVSYSARWHSVDFRNTSSAMAKGLAEISQAPQSLKSFQFFGDISLLSSLNLLNGPSLRTVELHSDGDLDPALSLPVAWHQLTHLSLTGSITAGVSIMDLIILLGRCPQLVSIFVSLGGDDLTGAATGGSTSTVLPFLDTFHIPQFRLVPSIALKYITDCVSMPQLRHLHVPTTPSDSDPADFSFASIGTNLPVLEDLTLRLSAIPSQSLAETLKSFPALTRLIVDAYSWAPTNGGTDLCRTTQVMETLLDTSICPRLEELVVLQTVFVSRATLDALIDGRMEAPHRLQRLFIKFQEPPPGNRGILISELSATETESYLSRGLDISIM